MNNLTVLISGASTGIGRDIAMTLARKYTVFAGVRNLESCEEFNEFTNITTITLDITDELHIQKAYDQIKSEIDQDSEFILINNAGVTVLGPIESISKKEWINQLDVNLVGHMCMIKAFLPLLRSNGGKIINMSSTSGFNAWPYAGAYAASKFALEGVSDALRGELRPFDIPVVLIEPGAVKTPIWDKVTKSLKNRFNHKTQYYYHGRMKATLEIINKGVQNSAVDAKVVTNTVLKIIKKNNPKARYRVGPSAKLQYILVKILPTCLYDFIKFYFPNRHHKKTNDWSGEKYLHALEMGSDIDMFFCRHNTTTDKTEWFLRSHAAGDGMASLRLIFKEEDGIELTKIPEVKAISKPNVFKRLMLAKKHIDRSKGLTYNWKNPKTGFIGTPLSLSYIFFSKEETTSILKFCKSKNSSITALFLWALDQSTSEILLNDSPERAWILPVNVRENQASGSEDKNMTSSLILRVKDGDDDLSIHKQIHTLYKEGLQWGAWIVSNLAKYVSRKNSKKFYKNSKLSWIGVFSNVANFPGKHYTGEIKPDIRWIAGPPCTHLTPITSSCMSWNNQLGITLQVHRNASDNPTSATEILNNLSKLVAKQMAEPEEQKLGTIYSYDWQDILANHKRYL